MDFNYGGDDLEFALICGYQVVPCEDGGVDGVIKMWGFSVSEADPWE